jgi:uncharacterized membrane protein
MNSALSYSLLIAAIPAFVASVVEFVEAFTIVLAVGTTRGWRAPSWGTAAAVVTLAFIVVLFGAPLITYHDQISQYFHLVVGVLLLLFGMRWLRKAILRFAGIIALHDEELIYQREVAELRAQGQTVGRWDNIGFWFSYKAVLLEGVEVAFIVIALGAQSPEALRASVFGAVAAFVLTMVVGLMLRRPLSFVPENWMKFVVGAMLTTFGIFWGAAGLGLEWPLGDVTLLLLLAGVCLVSWVGTRMLAIMLPEGARIAARSV